MAIARAKLVDLTVTRWYHCVSRCVRKAFLLGEGDDNRKLWLENRLAELAEIFAVAVGGFSDVKLVEYTGRLFRQEKASISAELAGIFERLGLSAQSWQSGMDKLRGDRLLGRFFAASRVKLREIAQSLGVRHLVNLKGCPLR